MAESSSKRLTVPPSIPEVIIPVQMEVKGTIPSWLNGRLIRLGPSLFELGGHKLNYLSDGMGLLQSFEIMDGQVSFRSRYVNSTTYRKNVEANRFVMNEFGTKASPDPEEKGLFSKLKSKLSSKEQSDNCNHNLFYWKENNALAVVGQSFLFEVDPETLETLGKCLLPDTLGVDIISDHVYVDKQDGSCYMLGSHVKGRPMYHIIQAPAAETLSKSLEQAKVVASVHGQFKVTSCTCHSFIVTENYFVIAQMPMTVNVLKVLTKGTIMEALDFDPKLKVKFHVISRATGKEISHKYETPAMYFLHSPNAYELNGHIVIDLMIMKDFKMQELFTSIEKMNSKLTTKDKPWHEFTEVSARYVLPVDDDIKNVTGSDSLKNLNLLENCKATACKDAKSVIQLTPQLLTEKGEDHIEYPCINPDVQGRPYKYFYAGGMGMSSFLKNGVGKVNVQSCHVQEWNGPTDHIPSEPVFVKNPEGENEDSGILLVTVQDFNTGKDYLLILDAESMTEVASVRFVEGHSGNAIIPTSDHGVFIPSTM